MQFPNSLAALPIFCLCILPCIYGEGNETGHAKASEAIRESSSKTQHATLNQTQSRSKKVQSGKGRNQTAVSLKPPTEGALTESWTADELECPNHGVLHRQCMFKCHIPGKDGGPKSCSVITDVKRCSCGGMKMEIKDKMIFSLDSGDMISVGSGFKSISGLCQSCVETCSKVSKKNRRQLKSSWKKIEFQCDPMNGTTPTPKATTMAYGLTSMMMGSTDSEEEWEESEETSEETEDYEESEEEYGSGRSAEMNSTEDEEVESSTMEGSAKALNATKEDQSEETEEESEEEMSEEEEISEESSVTAEAVQGSSSNMDLSYYDATSDYYEEPFEESKTQSERVASEDEEYFDPYLYDIYDDLGDIVRDKRSTDYESVQELNYYEDEKNLGQNLVESVPGAVNVQYQEDIEKLGQEEEPFSLEAFRVVSKRRPKNGRRRKSGSSGSNRNLVLHSTSYAPESELEAPETKNSTQSETTSATQIETNITKSIQLAANASTPSGPLGDFNKLNSTTIHWKGSVIEGLGSALENKFEAKTKFVPPSIYRSSACSPHGNETRTCIEDCAPDGQTCVMRVQLERCTCSGSHVVLTEVQKFDIARNEDIFLITPDGQHYGTGYVRECGSCVEYCRDWPGEMKTHQVNSRALSCEEVAKSLE